MEYDTSLTKLLDWREEKFNIGGTNELKMYIHINFNWMEYNRGVEMPFAVVGWLNKVVRTLQ